MHSNPINPIALLIFSIACGFILASAVWVGYTCGYRQGQIDAVQGDIYYHPVQVTEWQSIG